MKASVPAPGSSGASPRQLREELPAGLLQLADVSPGIGAQVRARAWTGRGPRRTACSIAPCRSTSMSSIVSAPAAMPATRHGTFRCAFTPHSPPGRTCSATRSPQAGALRRGPSPGPARRATRDSGHRTTRASSPGHATIALTRCPLEPGTGSVRTPILPAQRAPFTLTRPKAPLFDRWIEAKRGGERLLMIGVAAS